MTRARLPLWPLRQALAVAGAALLLRVVLFFLVKDSPFLHTPVVDASFFDIWARALAEGRVFQDQAFFKPPLYPYLLSLLYRLGLGLTAVLWLQMIVGVVTCLLTLAVGRLVFSARVAFGGALACALLPILPFFEIQLLAEAWTTALTMGGLLLLLLGLRDGASRAAMKLGAGGVLFGLAALGRPNLMLAVAVLAIWLAWKTGGLAWRRRGAVFLVAGFLVALAPATLHNLGHGEPVLISANLGANLVAGNSEAADGVSAIPVGILWDDLQLRTRQAGKRNPGAASRFLTAEALAWMADHPGRTWQLMGKKALLLIGAAEPRNNINPRWFAEKEGAWPLHRWWPGTWLLMPLALLGLVFRRGSGTPGIVLLRWYLLAQAVAVLPFFVNARFRAPLLPVLALFAAAGLFWLWEHRAERSRLVPGLVFLVVALVVVNVDWFGLGGPRWLARDHFNLGLIEARSYAGRAPRPVLAEEHFRKAVSLDPDAADFQERLGALLLARVPNLLGEAARLDAAGDVAGMQRIFRQADEYLDEAVQRHGRARTLFPRSFRSWSNLGTALMWQGDILSFRTNLAGRREDQEGARRLALQALSRYQVALQALQKSREIDPGQAEVDRQAQAALQSVMRLPPLDEAIVQAQEQVQAGKQGL